jgi:hypothetical protein
MKKYSYPGIRGHLEIRSYHEDGESCINIHGDPDGLRSFGKLLMALGELDQNTLTDYPDYAQEHVHLNPDWQLSLSSHSTVVGRLDDKAGGPFHDKFIPRTKPYSDAT